MRDNVYPGGPVMVKIDGSKIRQLREQKGLTQLYVATVVDVTTDTVSRWENKKYPSIKKENGIKLAEALEVELEEILENDIKTAVVQPETIAEDSSIDKNSPSPSRVSVTGLGKYISPRIFGFLLLGLILIVSTLFVFQHYFTNSAVTEKTTIHRTVPSHFIAGQPFPVFLHISTESQKPLSIIVRENVPPGTDVSATMPEASNKNRKDRSVQWLKKVKGSAVFVYNLKSDNHFKGSLQFNGILKIGSHDSHHLEITGDTLSTASMFHWADTNQDNKISDEEILVVYDLTETINSEGIDMDLLEEMWLGEGYLWNPDTQKYKILD